MHVSPKSRKLSTNIYLQIILDHMIDSLIVIKVNN